MKVLEIHDVWTGRNVSTEYVQAASKNEAMKMFASMKGVEFSTVTEIEIGDFFAVHRPYVFVDFQDGSEIEIDLVYGEKYFVMEK